MADDEFKRLLNGVDALYHEVVALREGAKAGGNPGKEELVLAELRLDNAWRELYEFMDLPLSRESGTGGGPE
ncbi:hypothetical protein J2809_000080 [Arthrobacter pascens]|uniref:hypothetical protein n=1 Tax=Arthrobacter pascens TaxID=1677 RepID=UPI00285CE194|nr:hypothetical protein [Arthrobacter pascens]MDR6555749.1 hypothetical protein [Arthrobacter pascens]